MDKRDRAKRSSRKLVLADVLTFRGAVRLPVSGNVPLADEARLIIESPEFQRLRGVRQLGPTHFVYPGAVHTRFEHSLGTYALSLRYVEALLQLEEFYRLGDPIKLARLLIVGALLHDVGHYPFSHLIEEIGDLPRLKLRKHELRAESIIGDSVISGILDKYWKLDPDSVCRLINGRGLHGEQAVIGSALSGVLDLDKQDYLVRDSIHCGINFGLSLDTGRFLSGLRIDDANKSICLSTKAESYVPTLITVRNLMYNEVYWHKTVRACVAMMKALVLRTLADESFTQIQWDQMLSSQDDQMAGQLYAHAKNKKDERLLQLAKPFAFAGRGLYKCVYVLSASDLQERPSATEFLTPLLQNQSSATCQAMALNLEKALQSCDLRILPGDILVECTPVKRGHETFDLQQARFLNERGSKPDKFVNQTYNLEGANNLLANSRKVFVLCHPERAPILRNLSNRKWEQVFGEADKFAITATTTNAK